MNLRSFLTRGSAAAALILPLALTAQANDLSEFTRDVPIARAWARNSVNAVIFRTHAVATHGDQQYTSFYGPEGNVFVARRQLESEKWEIHDTGLTGNTRDAHNAICHAIDGNGVLHLAWDHHGHDLNYVQGRESESLEVTGRKSMTGQNENRVTYPEFFNLANGDLLFLYRVGASGNGRMMLNRFDKKSRQWRAIHHPLIDGGGTVNAYTNQIAIDHENNWHLSWTWRSTGDVATNHNILYAVSTDEGKTWRKSTGEEYQIPITYETAEIVAEVPRNSELINQCSMTVDQRGRPLIASYWRSADSEIPQYHIVWHDGDDWRINQVSQRKTPFRLSGGGTRRIPISRPKVAVDSDDRVYLLYRDEERGSRISVAIADDTERQTWSHHDLTNDSVDMWEPNYDKQIWAEHNRFHIFKQRVGQGQRETLESLEPTPASILEWNPSHLFSQ